MYGINNTGDNDNDISDYGNAACHNSSDRCCNDCCADCKAEKGGKMKKIKLAEIALLAVSALITAAMSGIKFVNQIGKLKLKTEKE